MAEDFTLLVGDVREQLATLPDESVHCVVTSPPYFGLRDYGTGSWEGGDPGCDHARPTSTYNDSFNERWGQGGGQKKQEQKNDQQYADTCGKCGARRVDQQLGLEPTPDLYVENMVSVFREVRRVLRRDGTCWLNIGDSYNSGTNFNHDRQGSIGQPRYSEPGRASRPHLPTLKHKDLVGIPWRLAFALQTDGWYLRSEIIWSKPNPMPESVTDRPTKSHEQVFLLTKAARYFYDADAVREPAQYGYSETTNGRDVKWRASVGDATRAPTRAPTTVKPGDGTGGRNLRSVWEIATQPYPEAHFATYPEELVRRCVLAGTSEHGCCPECGAPWERETETDETLAESRRGTEAYQSGGVAKGATWAGTTPGVRKQVTTLGWRPTCECGEEQGVIGQVGTVAPAPIPCTILDPFLGSGTTALVARKHGRRCVGIELNPAYAELAERRNAQQTIFQEGVA